MRLTERMTLDPMRCLGCGKGNVPDNDGRIGPFIDLEQEVGWNDHAYLCLDCATRAGALVDMIAPDEYKDLKRTIRAHEEEAHELRSELDQTKARLKATQKRLLKVA
jgi:hypothetical protein